MIKDILEFFKKEKLATVVLILMVGMTIYSSLSHPPADEEVVDYGYSEAVQDFKQAEESLQKKIDDQEGMNEFLRSRPDIAFLMNSITISVLLLVGFGIAINFNWIFNSNLRKRIILARPPEKTDWQFSMLFKVILYFIFGGVSIAAFFEIFKFLGISVPMNTYLILHTTLVDILCLLLIYWVIKQSGGEFKDVGFRLLENNAWKEAKIGGLAYLAIFPIFLLSLVVLIIISSLLSYEPPAHPLVTVFLEEEKRSTWLVGYSIFLAVVIGPMLEEVFFRGFCYPILKKKIGMIGAMIVVSAFFAFIHDNTFAFVPIFILGLGLTYIYEIRHSLVAPMIIHVTHNLAFITYFFIAKKIVLQEAGG